MDLPIQPRVRGVCHGLGLHGRIDNDLLKATFSNGLRSLARLDGDLEQLFAALLPDPLAPFGHLARVDRKPMLEAFLATEVLVVGVLNPSLNDLLVREGVGVLEKVQVRQ